MIDEFNFSILSNMVEEVILCFSWNCLFVYYIMKLLLIFINFFKPFVLVPLIINITSLNNYTSNLTIYETDAIVNSC
ncbi:hypothetical protein RchiOBHm_Chr2g0145291 [Rosa chinensis]|uniref:Uncharacterized protein n=1 Tax=Rosa chinensis TaxID=74649 RepID=A0A2P6RYK9_ROSCH|nr:hypothetical protein RchiOBHm_Chr2g0145291 [Rosa chinensis]